MFALLLDFLLAYLLTRKIENIWLLVVSTIIAGLISSIVVTYIVYSVSNSAIPPEKAVLQFSLGLIFHPIITLFSATLLWKPKSNTFVASENENSCQHSQTFESDEITEYIKFINSSNSYTEISQKTAELLHSGYDSDSLLDIVRDRGGYESADIVRRAIQSNA